jgi:hypothetical protein
MQVINCVGGIANGAEDGTLPIVGVRWHRQRLIAVRSGHDMIVSIASAVTVVDDRAASVRSMSRRSPIEADPCDAHLWPFTDRARYTEVSTR